MDTIRLILVAVSGLLWLLSVIVNYGCIYIWIVKNKHVSGIPLPIGSLAGIFFLLILRVGGLSIWYCFIPLAMASDPLIWYSLGYFAYKAVRRRK